MKTPAAISPAISARVAALAVKRALFRLKQRGMPGELARARVMGDTWRTFAVSLVDDNAPRLLTARPFAVVSQLSKLVCRAILETETVSRK